MRQLISPSSGSTVIGTLKADTGGLGPTSGGLVNVAALNAVTVDKINQPNGVVGLNDQGYIDPIYIPNSGVMQIGIKGPITLVVGTQSTYQITNFDMFTTYTLTATNGSVTRNRDVITYKAPDTVLPGGFTINGRSISINITAAP